MTKILKMGESKNKGDYQIAKEWFDTYDADDYYSFPFICSFLKLDPQCVREEIYRQLESGDHKNRRFKQNTRAYKKAANF